MAERATVQCAKCGNPYSARRVDGVVVLPTDDGRCTCGCVEFVEVEGSADTVEAVAATEAQVHDEI